MSDKVKVETKALKSINPIIISTIVSASFTNFLELCSRVKLSFFCTLRT